MKKHNLKEYIEILEEEKQIKEIGNITQIKDTVVESISYNSKEVKKGTVFVCKGNSFKEEYLKQAIPGGAFLYISEKKYNVNIPYILVEDIKISLSIIADKYFNSPSKNLNVIGITGTKGKSTTAYYIKYILDEAANENNEKDTAIISSIDTYDGVLNFESHITTPESLDLQNHFNNAVNSKMKNVVMEVSSQALKYSRVNNVDFDYSIFLNISEDHISDLEHKDFKDYFDSKLKIFAKTNTAFVNLDSDNSKMISEIAKRDSKEVITFSTKEKKSDIYGYDIQKKGFDTVFKVKTSEFDKEFVLTMPGLFNVENALAAISVTTKMGISYENIYNGLKKAKSSGRMEVYYSKDKKIICIVDYAHNKLSFEKLYESTKSEYADRKITTVFGCPGKKALLRRRDLGLLAGENSDKIYITAEDPGEEPVEKISKEIAMYVKVNTNNYEIIEDREEAIKKAIEEAKKDTKKTIILITGKGNETRQKIRKRICTL
jgi:UDP-N-acetylmuramoyl-L-alanyl-D-glutamate--2,6-diaminopimelate ligase